MDKLEYALQILLLGFSVVMFTLFLLYGIISLFNRIFDRPAEKQAKQGVHPQRFHEINRTSSDLPPRVAAAVTAAVFHYLQLQGTAPSQAAISVQALQPSPQKCWAAAGRKNLLEKRLEHEQLRRKGRYEKI